MNDRRDFLKGGALAAGVGMLGAGRAEAQELRDFSGSSSFAATETAKPWERAQPVTAPIAIDIHNHWAPEAYLKAKAALGRPDFLDPINHDLDRRRTMMQAMGIATSVLSLGGGAPWPWATPEQGAQIARVANDAAIEAHKAYPAQFLGAIELNCNDPVGSLTELNRVAGKPGMVCVHLPTSLNGRDYLFAAEFVPVLARIEALRLPIFMHPLDGEENWFAGRRLVDPASGVPAGADFNAPEFRFPGLTNSLGYSLEVGMTIAKLITSGVLDRHPGLDFITILGGGVMPYAGGRFEYRGRLKQPLGTYLRRFHYDCLVYFPESLRYLAQMVGSDRIVVGTDNMYGPGKQLNEQPLTVVDQAGFGSADRDLIMQGNLKRLLRL